jgi:hypothetical protein
VTDDMGGRTRHLRAVPPAPTGRRTALTPAPSGRTLWAEELMSVVRAEVYAGVRTGVISAAESEELLARLNVVIDQALATN